MTWQVSIFDAYDNFKGLAIHRYRLPGSACRFSVWYNERGEVQAAERFDRLNRGHPPSAKQMEAIQKMGLYDFCEALNMAGRGYIIKGLANA